MLIKWHKIAEDISELSTLTEIEIANKKICVAIHNEVLFACAAKIKARLVTDFDPGMTTLISTGVAPRNIAGQ